jgi:hypothetical protein
VIVSAVDSGKAIMFALAGLMQLKTLREGGSNYQIVQLHCRRHF